MSRNPIPSLIIAAALLLTACGDDSRPRIDEWQARWESIRDLAPDAATIADEGTEVCGTFLGEVREQRDELTPAPTEAAEEAFGAWAEEAETLGLECEGGATDLDRQLARIDRLAARVDSAIGGR